MTKFPLEIVTPDRVFFSDKVDMVIVRGIEGDLAVLNNRTPLVTPLAIGKAKVVIDGNERYCALSNGYLKVSKEKTTIISDSAEWPEEIDVKRAEKAKERAEKRLKKRTDGLDVARAEIALKRAINRLQVSELKSVRNK